MSLTKEQNKEIRDFLNNASSPLFYFDNDQDGLCSYLLLRRMIGKGAGVPVKTSPLNLDYYRRVEEFNPDIVFILDQPTVSNDFFEKLNSQGITIVWIDHHENDLEKIPDYVYYYNTLYSGDFSNVPTTKMCYDIANNDSDLWLLIVGCVADKYVPKEYGAFFENYPDLGIDSSEAFKIFYESSIGKISRMVGAGLKDRTVFVMKMIRFLIDVKTPYEVLEENRDNFTVHKRFNDIDSKLNKLLNKAKDFVEEKFVFFKYSGETSMSADLSNKLSYLYPGKIIVVAYVRGVRVNISIRGKGVRDRVVELIKGIPFATGGGHEDAVGCQMDLDQLEEFVEDLKNYF